MRFVVRVYLFWQRTEVFLASLLSLGLIIESSLPLKSVEDNFAVDSSGFALGRKGNWNDTKWGRTRVQYGAPDDKQGWLKVHLMCGCKTNIVPGEIG